MTPSPPAWAMAIARLASVTVSMAADTIGMASEIERVSFVAVSVSPGITEDAAGFSSTSSKVRYSSSSAAMRSGAMPTSSVGDARAG